MTSRRRPRYPAPATLIALLAPALAATPARLYAGISAGAGPTDSWLGGGTARLTLGRGALAGEVGGRESLASADPRLVGGLFFGLRWRPPPPVYLRLGFAHHHETPLDVVRDQPVGAVFGTARGIVHRSGLELGAGLDFDLPGGPWLPQALADRVGLCVDLSSTWLPATAGPPVYLGVDVAWRVALGREAPP